MPNSCQSAALAPAVAGPAATPGPPPSLGRETPEQEAAFFYGLFLRGYSYSELRDDIDVPPAVMVKWQRSAERDPQFRSLAEQMIGYRRRVLAILQSLIAAKSRFIH